MVQSLRVIEAHERHAQAVAFSADGKWLVSVGMDAAVRLWKLPDFRAAASFAGHQKSVNSVALAPDGHRFATCSSDGTSKVWSFPEGRVLHTIPGQRSPRWSPDGRLLTTLSRPGCVAHWDGESCVPLGEITVADRRLFCLAFPPHEAELLVGGSGPIHRVRLHDGAPLGILAGHGAAVTSMALSPDRSLLASTGAEGELWLRDTDGWRVIREVPLGAGGMFHIVWMPSGDRVAVACDHGVRLIPVRAGEPVEHLEVGIKGLYGLAVSPDGQWLANAGADGRLRIWRFFE